ncbi:MAG: hypothetical protein ACREQ5_04285 [Candidatus Dormibacteria bacterium]
MPGIRITRFAGLRPEINPKALGDDEAQIAHNTLLWNGYLKPVPQWSFFGTHNPQPKSFYTQPGALFFPGFNAENNFFQAQVNWQEPFILGEIFGIYNNPITSELGIWHESFAGSPSPTKIIGTPTVSNLVYNVTHTNSSVYPIPRTYAITALDGNMESPPVVLTKVGLDDANLYEGDFVQITGTISVANFSKITGVRLYRTVPGFDTSEQVGNPIETAFHLVAENGNNFPSSSMFFVFNDYQSSDVISGSKLLSSQFTAPIVQFPVLLNQTESGWLVTGGNAESGVGSEFQVSERFLWHAWPGQNYFQIPDIVTDMVNFYDEIFIGTKARPYHVRIAENQNVELDSLDITVRPFPDEYACVNNTMVATNFGAMYASYTGLVALEVNEDIVVTKRVTNPGDNLVTPLTSFKIDATQSAAWWNGFYLGIVGNVAYLFNMQNNHNNYFPLQQLITLDTPNGVPGVNIVVGSGLYALWGTALYTWPLPGYGYDTALKATYTWKSKVFTMPGLTTMAAAKVVNGEDGNLTFSLFGDGNLIYTYNVLDSNPFRIPHQHKAVFWEVELVGTATVQEVHVATSMRELTEHRNPFLAQI